MKKLMLFILMALWGVSWADTEVDEHSQFMSYPQVTLSFPKPPLGSVFLGETLRIPMHMQYAHLRRTKTWYLPAGVSLEKVAGNCPQISGDKDTFHSGTCDMNLVIRGNAIGTTLGGGVHMRIQGTKDGYTFDVNSNELRFYVNVIPHNLSMAVIPLQNATANLGFKFDLRTVINYFDENTKAKIPAEAIVNPMEQDGIRFDKNNFTFTGKPTRTGPYIFNVRVKNVNGSTASSELKIEVGNNPKDKPVFKKQYDVATALPEQKYSISLLDLLEPSTGFSETNQIIFQIKPNVNNPDWLKITNDDLTVLKGKIDRNAAGTEIKMVLTATSNTGGDSDDFTIKIPVASDPTLKPVIDYFELKQAVGNSFFVDIARYIKNPASTSDFKVILDKVEPKASWLTISSFNPSVIEGTAPVEATGQKYLVTLRASTVTGGSSDPITIPLQIKIDKNLTPRFKASNPILPLVYPGQVYFYDFVAHKDVFPEYRDAPYEIKFAEGYEHPDWLKLENNKLIADRVSDDLDLVPDIYLEIKNIPGGSSGVIPLSLTLMN